MRIGTQYSYRFGKETIKSIEKGALYEEIIDLIASMRIPMRGRGAGRAVQEHFLSRGKDWNKEQPANPKEKRGMRFDLFKNRTAIEVNSSVGVHLYKDILKFTVANNLDIIDVGIEIVWDEDSAKKYLERYNSSVPTVRSAERRLQPFRPIISCPIWVVGLAQD